MRPQEAGQRLWQAFARADDAIVMRGAFYALLATAALFLVVDVREISKATQEFAPPAFDPQKVGQPVLPPALTDGKPHAPPVEPASDPQVLRQAIRFDLQPGGLLRAEGSIDPGAAERFRQEIETRGEYIKVVSLNSPGGSVDDALAMSSLIRERKLTTRVEKRALCASSCPIVMAGGTVREAEKDAVIGVHQIFNGSKERPSPEQAMSSAQSTTARLARHLDAMGIAASLWFHALETPPDRLYYLSGQEMKEFRLVTPPPTPVAKKRSP
ncbi:hypothetical protein ACFSE1_04525 [Rhizobium helianthi]|uniref:Periplasmic protein n=1 Tax=Rhizobium helianthi TaxID=1132695 RepID=A0ABW4M2D8_9HYPH